jgi:Flagellar C1a complex subunit C1a-32
MVADDGAGAVSLISLAWRHFSRTDLQEYASLETNAQRRALVGLVLRSSIAATPAGTTTGEEDAAVKDELRREIVTDLCFYALEFALDEIRLTALKASTFLSVLLAVHEWRVANPFLALGDAFRMFTELITRHSVDRTPHAAKIFDLFDVRAISRYVADTYFRNYHLYTAVFCPNGEVEISEKAPLLEIPTSFEPLASFEAAPEEPETTPESAADTPAEENATLSEEGPPDLAPGAEPRPTEAAADNTVAPARQPSASSAQSDEGEAGEQQVPVVGGSEAEISAVPDTGEASSASAQDVLAAQVKKIAEQAIQEAVERAKEDIAKQYRELR